MLDFVVSGLSVVTKCWVVCSNVGNISIVVASNVGSYDFKLIKILLYIVHNTIKIIKYCSYCTHRGTNEPNRSI